MKTKEELNVLKDEVETLNKKLAELTEQELAQVSGGYKKYEYRADGEYIDDLSGQDAGGAYSDGVTAQYRVNIYTDTGYTNEMRSH